ncbi:hypothetical protein V22_03300 [Calycomorphotria hydatis]|uniref:Uncharacterized protein n=1 Tax=Calycomorphotria hydatis TaxID=2528027 RepID=A0A517T432_9PLAN|nr:hypothetical protein V22_03300 [Calycomorphotria hydatis]
MEFEWVSVVGKPANFALFAVSRHIRRPLRETVAVSRFQKSVAIT